MARLRLLSATVLVLALFALWYLSGSATSAQTFLGGGQSVEAEDHEEDEDAVTRGFRLLDWLHYDVILASRTSYPQALMIGFTCYGNVLLRRECGDKPYPNWLFGWLLGFICYTYPGAVFSDLLFVPNAPLRAMSNNNILFWFSFWFAVIQHYEPAYKFLTRKEVFLLLTTWWLADATRASLLFLERSVTPPAAPVFARGVWQCFIWCGAGPLVRVGERCLRGEPVPKLDALQPNTLNVLKYPLVAMWAIMFGYLVFMSYFADCGIFRPGGLTMVECGSKYQDVFAFCTYLACALHLARGYWALYGPGGGHVIFGDTFCLGSCVKPPA